MIVSIFIAHHTESIDTSIIGPVACAVKVHFNQNLISLHRIWFEIPTIIIPAGQNPNNYEIPKSYNPNKLLSQQVRNPNKSESQQILNCKKDTSQY
jgi:hypothetical protein